MSDAKRRTARFDRIMREYGPALARLAATYTRQAVMLHLEGLSNAEIAEVPRTAEGNVAVGLTRARNALRKWLGEDRADE